MMILLPIVIGMAVGLVSRKFLKKDLSKANLIITLISVVVSAIGFGFNNLVFGSPVMNFMLLGLGLSATIANIVSEEKLGEIMTL